MYFDYYLLIYIYCGNSHKYYFLEGVTMAFPRLQKYFSVATLGAAPLFFVKSKLKNQG